MKSKYMSKGGAMKTKYMSMGSRAPGSPSKLKVTKKRFGTKAKKKK
tara:strand:- start:783 stop:920 length:138 start_codon:yes stop_codon:yes gene_type:complete